jgi:integrase
MVAFREYQTKKGTKIRAYLKKNGQLISKTVKTEKEGKDWAKKMEREEKGTTECLMYSDAIKSYLEFCSGKHTRGVVQEKLRHYRGFAKYIKRDIPVRDITFAIVSSYASHVLSNLRSKTANRHLRHFKAVWGWMIKCDYISKNPWAKLDRYPEVEHRPYIPSKKEVQAILNVANQFERDYIIMLLRTAARTGEIRNLRWLDIKFDEGLIYLHTRKRRYGDYVRRVVPMTDDVREILNRYWNDQDQTDYIFLNPRTKKPFTKNSTRYKHMMTRLCRLANVQKTELKSLRHFVSCNLCKDGAGLASIQRILGHQRPTTTDNYLKKIAPTEDELKGILESYLSVGMHESMHNPLKRKSGTPYDAPEPLTGGEGGI